MEGKQLPSFAVKYNQGTECTLLANEPRETTVFYSNSFFSLSAAQSSSLDSTGDIFSLMPISSDFYRFYFFFFKVCEESGNENIISFEEISTCKYEMIVTSKSFCSHPAFELIK